MQPSAPLALNTSQGRALLVIGSLELGMPCYEVNGMPVDIDVRVPEDLKEHWTWFGSFLCRVHAPGEVGISICADTFGVQGAFTQARELERLRAETEMQPVQLEMF